MACTMPGAALLVALAAPPAAAFWPLATPMEAPFDSTRAAQIETRWDAFRSGANAPIDTTAATAATDSVAPPASAATLAAAAAARATAVRDSIAAASREPDSTFVAAAADTATTGAGGAADLAAMAAAASAAAAAAGTTTTTAPGGANPALMAALAAQAAAARGWAPELTSKFSSSNDNMTGAADLKTTFSDPSGLTLANTIGSEKNINKLRNDQQETHRLTNALSIPLPGKWLSMNLTTANTRTNLDAGPRNNAVSKRDTDMRSGQASLRLSRPLDRTPGLERMGGIVRGLTLNGFYGYDVSASRNNLGIEGNPGASSNRRRGTGNAYGAGVTFDRLRWVTMRARIGRLRRNNDDTTLQFVRADSLIRRDQDSQGEGDTTSVDVTIPAVGIVQSITFGFRNARGEDTVPEPATGSSGQTISGSGFQFETTSFRSRVFNVAATVRPLRRLNSAVTVSVARDSTNYRIKRLQFTDTRRVEFKIDNRLTFWKDATLGAIFEYKKADVNRDVFIDSLETNPLTHDDVQHRLYVEANKPLTASMRLIVSGEMKLDAGFYAHPVPNQGLSDLDQFRTELKAVLTGNLNARATGAVTAYVRTYDQAFIDRQRSASSRDETEYVVRPSYSWTVSDRVTVQQSFGLESKVIEPIFAPENSTLNRRHYASTTFTYRPLTRLRLDGAYDYLLQDSGKYTTLAGGGERFFSREQRSKKDQINLAANYTLISGDKLVFTSQETVNRFRTSFGDSRSTVTEQRTLRLGFTSALQVGELKLDARMFRLQNNNAQLDRDVVWNGDATLVWTF